MAITRTQHTVRWTPDHLASSYFSCVFVCVCDMCVLVAQSFSTLCDSMDCSPTVSSVHEILHAKVLEWVAISFSRGSSQPKDWAQVSCIAGRFFTNWINRETALFLLSRCNIKSFCLPCSSSSASVQSLQLLSHVKLLETHWLHHTRLPCPSPTPRDCSDSCPSLDGDVIHPSHPLLSPYPPKFNLSLHQGLFQWVSFSHLVAKVKY